MKTFTYLLAALLAPAGSPRAADLVSNGSFETPEVSSLPRHVSQPLGYSLAVAPGTTTIPGWRVVGDDVAWTQTPYNEGFETLQAGHGLQCLDLTGMVPNGQGGVEQSVLTTPGRHYVVTFQLGIHPGSAHYSGPLRVNVSAGSVSRDFLYDATAPTTHTAWQSFALPFEATAATTLIRIANVQANDWSGLDRVAVAEAGPSPGLLSLPSWTVDGGGGISQSSGGRFTLCATAGQADAGWMPAGPHLASGGFWGPGQQLRIAVAGELVEVSWTFGLGLNELETASLLHSDPTLNEWTPVSLAQDARSVLFPAADGPRFFRIREN